MAEQYEKTGNASSDRLKTISARYRKSALCDMVIICVILTVCAGIFLFAENLSAYVANFQKTDAQLAAEIAVERAEAELLQAEAEIDRAIAELGVPVAELIREVPRYVGPIIKEYLSERGLTGIRDDPFDDEDPAEGKHSDDSEDPERPPLFRVPDSSSRIIAPQNTLRDKWVGLSEKSNWHLADVIVNSSSSKMDSLIRSIETRLENGEVVSDGELQLLTEVIRAERDVELGEMAAREREAKASMGAMFGGSVNESSSNELQVERIRADRDIAVAGIESDAKIRQAEIESDQERFNSDRVWWLRKPVGFEDNAEVRVAKIEAEAQIEIASENAELEMFQIESESGFSQNVANKLSSTLTRTGCVILAIWLVKIFVRKREQSIILAAHYEMLSEAFALRVSADGGDLHDYVELLTPSHLAPVSDASSPIEETAKLVRELKGLGK